MVSGIDAHECCRDAPRDDVAPRATPVTDEERTDSIAASIFAGWTTRPEDVGRTGGLQIYTQGASGESTLWDNETTAAVETRDEILLGALRDGLTFLNSKFDSPDPENWLWGTIHQVRFQHFAGQAGRTLFDLGPIAAPGGRFTVNPAN